MLPSLSIRQLPLLRLAIMIMAGMTVSRLFISEPDVVTIIVVLVIILGISLLIYLTSSPSTKSIGVHLIGVCTGFILYNSHQLSQVVDPSTSQQFALSALRFYEVENLNSNEKYTTLFTRYIGDAQASTTKRIGVVVRIKNDTTNILYRRGIVVSSSGKVRPIESRPTPTGFDYSQYLEDQGYQFQFFTKPNLISSHEAKAYPWWQHIRYDVRNKFLAIIDLQLDAPTAKITKALVLGDRSGLDDETRASYADSGIIHILAVSGLHVGIIAWLLFQFIDRSIWWLKQHHWLKSLLVIMGLVLFAELSGGAAPVWRAVVMSSIYLIAKTLGRKSHSMNLLGLAAIVILLFRPTDLFTVSFQLSFTAVSGILLFSPWLFKLYDPDNTLLKRGWTIIVLGICAQLGTLPLTLYYFHQFPLLSPIAGLVAIPAAGVILGTGIGLIITGMILPSLSFVFAVILKYVVIMLNTVAAFIAWLPGSLITDIWITPISAVLIFCTVVALACWLYLQDRRFYKGAITILGLVLISHVGWREYSYYTPQTITYSQTPLSVDILLRGNCYHYNEDQEQPVSSYLTDDVRSKYRVNEVITIDKPFIDILKNKHQ